MFEVLCVSEKGTANMLTQSKQGLPEDVVLGLERHPGILETA